MGAPLPPVHSGARRVALTHDGKPLGYSEPLDADNPFRKGFSLKSLKARNAFKEMNARGGRKAGSIRAAQQRSATRRGA